MDQTIFDIELCVIDPELLGLVRTAAQQLRRGKVKNVDIELILRRLCPPAHAVYRDVVIAEFVPVNSRRIGEPDTVGDVFDRQPAVRLVGKSRGPHGEHQRKHQHHGEHIAQWFLHKHDLPINIICPPNAFICPCGFTQIQYML